MVDRTPLPPQDIEIVYIFVNCKVLRTIERTSISISETALSAIGIIGTISFLVAAFTGSQYSFDKAPPGYRALHALGQIQPQKRILRVYGKTEFFKETQK